MHLATWLWTVVIYSQWLYIVLEHSRSLCNLNLNLNHLIVHTKWLVNMQMMSLYCGLPIVWTLIDRLHRDIAGFMYLLDVLVVVVHISHRNCWEHLLLHQDWGECSEGWAGAWGVGVGGGAGGWKFLVAEIIPKKFQKCSWGSETHAIYFYFLEGGGGILGCLGCPTPPTGGRAGSENDTLLPMTMTCDRLKFWSGPAWRSKVIIGKPWRRKNKKQKTKFWQNHKAFPAGNA